MLTFNIYQRNSESEKVLNNNNGIFPGWEETIHVFRNGVFLCQINTAQAHCCGYNTLEKVRCWGLNKEETETFWEEVSYFFNKKRTSCFRVGELFHVNTESVQKTSFFLHSSVEPVYKYRSASEPRHDTFLFKFQLCSS